jgi:DNA-binding transcriptional LysR family regulator
MLRDLLFAAYITGMNEISYPLSVLVKAVGFKNLSAASSHVGLSQPQLSRIIAGLEGELGFELLNRQVRRKACWTNEALKLAEMYNRHHRRLESAIKALQSEGKMRVVHVGTLEGLAAAAVNATEMLFRIPPVELVTLDVYDRSELEAKFLGGDLDLIFTTRVPDQGKPKFKHRIGYQSLDSVDKESPYQVFSSFEFNQRRKKPAPHTLVSNSLAVRRLWIEQFGGHGWLPSELAEKPRRGGEEVFLLAGDWIDTGLWESLVKNMSK